ncbi:GNAT family N-acetyltransferase [Halobacteriales archaeon QS_6_71_20]|nr:MAG: GNAT family N-acetyltransferase [Halobacteriales archaeon QS_6_71_20]
MTRVREADPADAAAVRRVHEASILGLGPRGYDAEQVDAWAGDRTPADYGHLGGAGRHSVVAERDGDADGDSRGDGAVVGFGELTPERADYLAGPPATVGGDDAAVGAVEAVYVHPAHAGEGVGSALLAALEREASARGLDALGLHASLNAVGFYERRGYEREREATHAFGDDPDVTGTVVELWKRLDRGPR